MIRKAIGRAVCSILGDKWSEQSRVAVTTGPRGKGSIIWEECSRCGETRCRWVADFALGRITQKEEVTPTVKITPEICKEVDPHVEVESTSEATSEVKAPKSRAVKSSEEAPKAA